MSDVAQQTQSTKDTIEAVHLTATETEQVTTEAKQTLEQSVGTMDGIFKKINQGMSGIVEVVKRL